MHNGTIETTVTTYNRGASEPYYRYAIRTTWNVEIAGNHRTTRWTTQVMTIDRMGVAADATEPFTFEVMDGSTQAMMRFDFNRFAPLSGEITSTYQGGHRHALKAHADVVSLVMG